METSETSIDSEMTTPNKDKDQIIIIGAGIFGLSTAIHLAQRGYTQITVFDRQPYHETLYDYEKGCDAASAGTFPSILCIFYYIQRKRLC
jgi:glycine/D-amino acid oxidase-like deaminating enzyme